MPRLTDRPPPPPGSPFLPPPSRQPLPPPPATLQQRAWAGLTLAMLSLITLMMIGNIRRGGYVAAVALAVAVIGLVMAISAMSAARRSSTSRPRGALAGAVLGVIGLVLSGSMLTVFIALRPQLDQYASCMDGAGTVSAQQACRQQLNKAINTEINILSGK